MDRKTGDRNTVFDGAIPEHYDRHLGPVLFEPYAEDLVGRLKLREDAQVLEIACGTGIVTRRLRERMPPKARLTATDLNEPMLEYAKRKLAGTPGIEWRAADAAALPFPAASFDAVVCQFGIMFVPDKGAAVREARRVLRPGGVFAFNVWDRLEENDLGQIAHETITRFFPEDPPQFYSIPFGFHNPAEIHSLLGQGGFTEIQVDSVASVAECASPREVATGLIRGNPTVNAIQERGGVEVDTVVDAVADAIRKRCGESPSRAKRRALVWMARAGEAGSA